MLGEGLGGDEGGKPTIQLPGPGQFEGGGGRLEIEFLWRSWDSRPLLISEKKS